MGTALSQLELLRHPTMDMKEINMTRTASFAAVLAGALALPAAALAQTATVVTDLNLRIGPGPTYEIVTVAPGNEIVTIHGCNEAMTWCEVSFADQTGWAYAEYLAYEVDEEPMIVPEAATRVEIPTRTYDTQATGTVTGAAGGAITGAIIGGPVGAAIGGVAGATLGGAISAPPRVTTYVVEQPVDPVFLEGEVVVGATLPEPVVLHAVPDYEYQFAYVNHQRVLVDPGTREVVYIVR
jgi:uncharacterized protein YraI